MCECEYWFSSLKFVEFRLDFVLRCFGNVGVCTYRWFGASNARYRFLAIEKAASKGREGKLFCCLCNFSVGFGSYVEDSALG